MVIGEIEKVILKNGEDKNYKVNQSVDYFQLKDSKGFPSESNATV